jgi:hypothetical protein
MTPEQVAEVVSKAKPRCTVILCDSNVWLVLALSKHVQTDGLRSPPSECRGRVGRQVTMLRLLQNNIFEHQALPRRLSPKKDGGWIASLDNA